MTFTRGLSRTFFSGSWSLHLCSKSHIACISARVLAAKLVVGPARPRLSHRHRQPHLPRLGGRNSIRYSNSTSIRTDIFQFFFTKFKFFSLDQTCQILRWRTRKYARFVFTNSRIPLWSYVAANLFASHVYKVAL